MVFFAIVITSDYVREIWAILSQKSFSDSNRWINSWSGTFDNKLSTTKFLEFGSWNLDNTINGFIFLSTFRKHFSFVLSFQRKKNWLMWFHRHICRNKSINFASIDQFQTFKSEKSCKACACFHRINEKSPNKIFSATQMCGMSTEVKKACTYAQCTCIHFKPDFFHISIMDRTFKLLLNSYI